MADLADNEKESPMKRVSLHFSSVDNMEGEFKEFDTEAEAGVWARKMIGDHPEMGQWYATDGVAKIVSNTEGLRTADLFPGSE